MRFIVNRLMSPFAGALILYENGWKHILASTFVDILFCVFVPIKWYWQSLIIAFVLIPIEGFISAAISTNNKKTEEEEKPSEEDKEEHIRKQNLIRKLDAYSIRVVEELEIYLSDEEFEAIPKDKETTEALRNAIGVMFFMLRDPAEAAEEIGDAVELAHYTDRDYRKAFNEVEEKGKAILKRVNSRMKKKYGKEVDVSY